MKDMQPYSILFPRSCNRMKECVEGIAITVKVSKW